MDMVRRRRKIITQRNAVFRQGSPELFGSVLRG